MDELAAEGSRVLVEGLMSAGWERVAGRFVEWFALSGQDEFVDELRQLTGPLTYELKADAILTQLRWRLRLSEGLADAWDVDGVDELAALISEFDATPRPEEPTPAPAEAPVAPGDRFDFQGITVNGQFVGVQHVQQTPPAAHSGSVDWPLAAAEDMEALSYGVRPTRRGKNLPRLPPYVGRDVDQAVGSAVESAASEGGLVVVRGDAYVGKSRTALAVMAQVLVGVRVFAPARHENLRGLPALLRGLGGERCAVWLDDLDGHLDAGGLEPRLLAQLTGQGVAVVATMREDAYDEVRQTSQGRVLDLAHIVDLPRTWSRGERTRAAQSEDPRLVEAARRCGAEGVASYLAVGPQLWEEWQRARRADRHPRGYALVRAAVDLARCGLRGPLPQDLLLKVHEEYDIVAGMDRESVDDALAWAGKRRHGMQRLLRRSGANMWEASPYLVDTASQDEMSPAVDGAVWGVALEVARADPAYDLGAVVVGARKAFRAVAEAGDRQAAHSLGLLEQSLGDAGEAEAWFRRAAEAGHPEAAGRLGRMLSERGDTKGAEPFLETAAEAGDHEAATLLGKTLKDRAVKWLERARQSGNPEAARLLGDLYVGSGDYGFAESCYSVAEMRGYADIARNMGLLRLLENAGDAAMVWLERAAASGDDAAQDLLEAAEDSPEGVDGYFLDSSRYPLDRSHLGVLLEKQGRLDEARAKYEEGYRIGDAYGAYRVALLLDGEGKVEEAKAWYRKAADMGHSAAKKALGEKPQPLDTVTE